MEYLSFWGYPEIIETSLNDEKLIILDSIYKNYIEKDIIAFLKIENIRAFNNLIKILSWQVWNLLNKNEISNTIWISRITLDKYLEILSWTFIFDYLPPYFSNIRKELTKMPKVFARDLWILNYSLWKNLSLKNDIDLWAIVENFIYRELKNKNNFSKLYFYQTVSKSEIDFILEDFEKKLSVIEVKYRKKVVIPSIFKRFDDNYSELIKNKIIFTKDICKYENWIYYIPALLVSLIDF
jgi:predicted AAA+ superfamily ATPase